MTSPAPTPLVEDRHVARHVEGTCDGCPLCCCDHPDHAELWKGQCPDCRWRAVQEAKK